MYNIDDIRLAVYKTALNSDDFKNSKILKEYLKGIKRSKILSLEHKISEKLNSSEFKEKISPEFKNYFMIDLLKSMKQYKKDDVLSENEKLYVNIINNINESERNVFESFINQDSLIGNMIIESAKNGDYLNKYKMITEIASQKNYTKEDDLLKNDLSLNHLTKLTSKKFNEKFSFLDETEIKIVRGYIFEDHEILEEEFNKLLTENIKLAKRKRYELEDNNEVTEKISAVLDKLNKMSYKTETAIEQFTKLIDLKNSLK